MRMTRKLARRDAEPVIDIPPHQVLRRDAFAEVVGVALHPMHLVTMTNEEVVQPEPIGGRGLPETEHLHLEKRSLAADEVLEGFEDGQVESFGVDLDEAKPRDEVGVLSCEIGRASCRERV